MIKKMPLYERFSHELEEQILAGTFPEGERIPALRESATAHKLSLMTVLQAYRLLETRGLIEARPQSGYYVKFRNRGKRLESEPAPVCDDPSEVSVDDLSMLLFRDNHEKDFAKFGAVSQDPDLLPSARLNRIVGDLAREGKFDQDSSFYPEGCEELRIQVAQRVFGYGCSIGPDDLVITVGCSEAMFLCLQTVCRPGDLVAIESPTYFGILLALESLNLKALEIPTNPGAGMSLDALEFALENHPVKAVVAMTNFSNPLGSCMSDDAKKRLVGMIERKAIALIENDIYGEIYFSEHRPSVAKSFDRSGLVMLCSSFSKDISPAYRVGWVAPGKFLQQLIRRKLALNTSSSILPQLTIARYLESGGYDQHLRKIRKAYARKMAQMISAIEKHFPEDTRCTEPEGGYVIWVRLPGGLDSLVLYREAVKSRISIAPGYLFSLSHRHRDYIRLNAAIWSERTEADLARLGMIVHRLMGTVPKKT